MRPLATVSLGLVCAVCLSSPALAEPPETLETQAGPVKVSRLAADLDHPWGMAFLPDGRLLVTERAGDLRILDKANKLSEPVEGTPKVFAEGQGGLLDVALDPNFESNGWIYLSFAESGEGGASSALGRGKWVNDRIQDFQVIFRQTPKLSGNAHFGGRILFSPEGQLFFTLGERFKFEPAQDLSNHLGTIVRINPDGTVPKDNPFVNQKNAQPEIWSYGHRNIQSAAFHPQTGRLWVAEMGPRHGDELNLPEKGRNYGWPIVSWGDHYDGREIPDPPTRPEFADSVMQWTPGIAPSGMLFYQGELFPAWRNSALIGALKGEAILRVAEQDGRIQEVERLEMDTRIRDLEQAPDGSVYAITDEDNGQVLRLAPAR